jgi:GNAT superfamily N-acetyltransferase
VLSNTSTQVRSAVPDDVPLVLSFIRELAEYERMADEVVATEDLLRHHLFGPRTCAEVVLAFHDDEPVGFALFFHNFSTFLGQPGIYLEDLFVKPHARGLGIGKQLMSHVAALALERGCGRFEWAVLNWNEPAIEFYRRLGAVPMTEWTVQRVTGSDLEKLARG